MWLLLQSSISQSSSSSLASMSSARSRTNSVAISTWPLIWK
eukprot:CAMPEP_0206631778 /NCGR_PEP_ID=MMETSP0325_2-20121206/68468_1 /ASSEMBLY_ACC=CAM_ASM_000347 /TAXON_ID=2866 /ORGANISM="Crypthecodinium cohnii, Strain Seligo" /LENGTH=40 /DNA_ID= /DNA_START= /DNA_END= /DNA_ORIENTATION=